ncbi:hypothetical protein E1289_26555, partial [Actinomadura sp. 6K520]
MTLFTTGSALRAAHPDELPTHHTPSRTDDGPAEHSHKDLHGPAPGPLAGTVDFAGRAEVDAAVAAARAAFPGWRDASLS